MAIVSLNDLPPELAALAVAEFYATGYWSGGITSTVRDTADIFEWPLDRNGNEAEEIQTYGWDLIPSETIPLAEKFDWKRRIRAFGGLGAKTGNGNGGGRKGDLTEAECEDIAWALHEDGIEHPKSYLSDRIKRIEATHPEYRDRIKRSNGGLKIGIERARDALLASNPRRSPDLPNRFGRSDESASR